MGIPDQQLASLIEPLELMALLPREDVVIIDTRDVTMYQKGHLPGAVSFQNVFYYLCLPENGGLPGMQAFFIRLFSEAGVRPQDRVIFYEDAQDNGYGRSCRGWLLMKYLGHPNVQVLHGGYRGWIAAHLPVEHNPVTRTPYAFESSITAGHIIGTDEMLPAMLGKQTLLVDCRDYAEWLGANSSPYGYDYCPRKGRIPGSLWLEWYQLIDHRGGVAWFRSPEEIREMCIRAGIVPDKPIIVYCFKGARASAVVLALRRSGFENVLNYFPSWNEWSRDFNLPVDEEYPEQ